MKKQILVFTSFLLITVLFIPTFSQNSKIDIKQYAKAAEEVARLKPENEKKIAGIILERINKMVSENAQTRIGSEEIVRLYSSELLKVDKAGRVYVNVSLKRDATKIEMDLVSNKIESLGGVIRKANFPKAPIEWIPEIYCWIPFNVVKETAKDSLIGTIGIVPVAFTRIGDYTTAGDGQLKAYQARQYFNVDGSGVKVGVISDGIDHWEESKNSGDLPQFVYRVTNHDQRDEGTAMLEIVYDLAPGSELYFGGVGFGDEGGSNDMVDTVFALINQGCKIVVDDIGWYGVPFFYDDYLCQSITNFINQYDISYISAAGNDGDKSWDGIFYNDNYDWNVFWIEESTPYNYNRVLIDYNETVTIFLQWASDWDNPSDNYDLYLLDNYDNVVAQSTSSQPGNHPEEIIEYTNNGASDYFKIKVKKVSGDDREIKLYVHSYNRIDYTYPNYEQGIDRPVRQIFGHSSAQKVISTAAYPASNQNSLETFSSRGPSKVYIDPNNFEIRKTPTITATDGVETKTGALGYFAFPFYGTSAAAPHIAGIAALYFDKYGTGKPPEDFYDDLTSDASTIYYGTGGVYNDQTGYGKANSVEALGGMAGNVVVEQLNQSGANTGEFEHWGGSEWEPPYTAPHTFDWQSGTDQTLRAEQDVWYGEKFQYWNSPDTIINHFTFNITENTIDLKAQLWPVNESTVKTYLISAGGADPAEDSIEFKDPWLSDYNDPPYGMRNQGMAAPLKTYASPLNLTSSSAFKGVFLNQDPEFDPDIPNYSVRAEDPQTIPFHGQNITWYFQGWSGTDVQFQHSNQNETAVVFKQANAVAQANYKGHLASNKSSATALNNGRRLVQDDGGKWHMVYEDNGHIYYSYSTNDGGTWQPELRLSKGANNNSRPAISIGWMGSEYDVINVVWNSGSGEAHYVNWRNKMLGNEWSDTYTTSSDWLMGAAENTTPVAIGGPVLYFFCAHNYNNQYTLLELYRFMEGELEMLGYIQGENKVPRHPTIGQSPQPSSVIHLAWEDRNQIYYTYFLNGSFGEIEEVTLPDAGIEINIEPSLSVDLDGKINVAWSGFDVGLNAYVLLHRQRGASWNGQWGELNEVYYSYSDITHPTIGSFIDVNKQGWFNVAFNFNNSSVKAIQYQGDSWQWLNFLENGKYPSFGDHSEEMMLIWTDHTTELPYIVKDEFFDEQIPQEADKSTILAQHSMENTPELVEKHYRKEIFSFSNLPALNLGGNASLSIGDIKIYSVDSSWTWKFVKYTDSLNTGPFLQTKPLLITPDMLSAKVHFRANVTGFSSLQPLPNRPLFRLRLLNGHSLQPVVSLNQLMLNSLTGSNFILNDSLVIDLSRYAGNSIVVNMQTLFDLTVQTGMKPDRMNIYEYYPVVPAEQINGGDITAIQAIQLPRQFELNQNYPNPFNPTTTISFDLPKEALVKLQIYDVTGRQIRTLTNARYPAGSHRVQWNGKDEQGNMVASGVYVYRLVADSYGEAGNYTQTRKMMLLK